MIHCDMSIIYMQIYKYLRGIRSHPLLASHLALTSILTTEDYYSLHHWEHTMQKQRMKRILIIVLLLILVGAAGLLYARNINLFAPSATTSREVHLHAGAN